jgi:transposase
MVVEPQSLQSLSAEELRELTTRLMTQLRHQSALLDKLTHENALLKRMKFAAQSERFNPEQKSLLEDEIEADLAAVATEIDALQEAQAPAKVEEKKVPSARRCQQTYRVARSATSPSPPCASAAAR